MPKILILHDTFLYRGGAERLVILMAITLGADIASGFFSPGSYTLSDHGFVGKSISLMPKFFQYEFPWLPEKLRFLATNGLRKIGLKWSFSRKRLGELAKQYETIILSGDCLSGARHFRENKVIYYCHTIPRYLFDQKENYEQKVPFFIRPIYRLFTKKFRTSYLSEISQIETIVTNSKNTQNRIKTFTKKDSFILYPPVDTELFTYKKNKLKINKSKYFLSFARLCSTKRVDKIVEAFQGLPKEKLIITYGKSHPDTEKITKMVENFPNITLRESPSDGELVDLIQNAKATIYVPVDEDFGMSPLESMACGVPVIGVDDGGLKESIIDGKTGILIDPACNTEDIKTAVKKIQEKDFSPETCISQAEKFSLKSFQKKLEELIYYLHNPPYFTWQSFGVPLLLSEEYLSAVSKAVYRVTHIPQRGVINLVTITQEEMSAMNEIHRGGEGPTDILTFSYLSSVKDNTDVAGEIYLYLDKIREYAHERGNSYEDQLKFIVIHGLLHLLGYDHENDGDIKIMQDIEDMVVERVM